ncbi:MAG: tetratricopeptide repeat protein [Proteobacteria bacterium]|nr:tetratricopeptide repeat protein [Pseudomonadota bacterium]
MINIKKIIYGFLITGLVLMVGCGGIAELTKAELKLGNKNYDEAITLYKEYLAKRPNSAIGHSKLGFAYLKTGRLDEAVSEFQTALKADPGEPFSTYYLGLAYLNKEDYEKAIAVWQGYRNMTQPLVEEEIRRQLTLLQIAYSHKAAVKALAEEKNLMAAKPDTNTVAVCYYQDLSPDKSLRAFQKGLASMIITDLSKVKSVRVVERVRLQALLEEMKLGQTGIVDPKTAPRLGKLLGAENIVVGNLSSGSIKAVTTLASTGKGNVKGSASVSVDKNKFFEIPVIIVRDIAKILGITLSDDESKAIGIPHTKVYNALIYYGNALYALDAGKWKEAKDFFAMALKEDPAFALAKQGADSCPGAGSPGVSAVSGMSAASLSDRSEVGVSKASDSQSVADAEAASAGRGGGCFSYDTKVLMADNSFKRIIDLREGEYVKACDIDAGEVVNRKVTNKYRADQNHYYLINSDIRITENHPVFTADAKWVKVADLEVGDSMATIDGSVKISSIDRIEYDHRVYNFQVDDSHNYYVSAHGKEVYLVHNSK